MEKTVLITGGARRIGKSLSENFAKKGYNVIINYNNSQNKAEKLQVEIIKLGVKCEIIKADVSKFDEVKNMFAIIQNFSDKDMIPNILINNAGVFTPQTAFEDLELKVWEDTINTNLSSQYFCSQEFLKLTKYYKLIGSKIVNFASLGGIEVWKDRTSYNVSKAGVIQLTKSLARDLAPLISVNCISPGTIEIEDENASENLRITTDRIPMGRFGNVDDIFDAVYFLATCSDFITGNNIIVDGGYSLKR